MDKKPNVKEVKDLYFADWSAASTQTILHLSISNN